MQSLWILVGTFLTVLTYVFVKPVDVNISFR